jgi:hypothetical protein
MAFIGMVQIRSKIFFHWHFHFYVDSLQICKDNNALKLINNINYLWCNITHEGDKDLNVKNVNFVKILGIINRSSNHY